MIVKENIEIGGKSFVKQYSDGGFYIERDGERYSEAIDPSEFGRTYTETDMPVEAEKQSPDKGRNQPRRGTRLKCSENWGLM